jgi:hypothetical protein
VAIWSKVLLVWNGLEAPSFVTAVVGGLSVMLLRAHDRGRFFRLSRDPLARTHARSARYRARSRRYDPRGGCAWQWQLRNRVAGAALRVIEMARCANSPGSPSSALQQSRGAAYTHDRAAYLVATAA